MFYLVFWCSKFGTFINFQYTFYLAIKQELQAFKGSSKSNISVLLVRSCFEYQIIVQYLEYAYRGRASFWGELGSIGGLWGFLRD